MTVLGLLPLPRRVRLSAPLVGCVHSSVMGGFPTSANGSDLYTALYSEMSLDGTEDPSGAAKQLADVLWHARRYGHRPAQVTRRGVAETVAEVVNGKIVPIDPTSAHDAPVPN